MNKDVGTGIVLIAFIAILFWSGIWVGYLWNERSVACPNPLSVEKFMAACLELRDIGSNGKSNGGER